MQQPDDRSWEEEHIHHLNKEIEVLKNAIGNISISHQEPQDYKWYSECNGCGENLDKNKHDDDCPFVLAKIVTQK